MGDAFIVRRGGGIADAFAVIAVAYPSGSVCTCTKGSKTLRAKDTSGYFLFLIPEAGTWTVSCTDGTRTKSQNIVIQYQYQAECVKLSYQLYLFQQNVGLASGYVSGYFGNTVRFENTINGGGTFYIVPSSGVIDLSSFSTLYVEMQRPSAVGEYPFGLGSIPTADSDAGQGTWLAKFGSTTSAYPDKKTFSLDVSNITTADCFKVYSGNNSFANIYYNILLE